MPAVATTLIALLTTIDSQRRADYERRLSKFEGALKPLKEQVAALRQKYAAVSITATESVFGYKATAVSVSK
jgi:zinc/manganese transport system substrate-binding protein